MVRVSVQWGFFLQTLPQPDLAQRIGPPFCGDNATGWISCNLRGWVQTGCCKCKHIHKETKHESAPTWVGKNFCIDSIFRYWIFQNCCRESLGMVNRDVAQMVEREREWGRTAEWSRKIRVECRFWLARRFITEGNVFMHSNFFRRVNALWVFWRQRENIDQLTISRPVQSV